MNDDTTDYEFDHDCWEDYYYDFTSGTMDTSDESVEEMLKRIKREREEAYDRAMDIL